MPDFLKGNYKLDKTVEASEEDKNSEANNEFEREALKRLGGSIAFATRKGFMWKGDEGGEA